MTASIINKTFKSIVAASAALIMAASVAACGPSAATPSMFAHLQLFFLWTDN